MPYWVIILATFLILNGLHQIAESRFPEPISNTTLVAYLTLTRNFIPSSWSLNTSLWFMPIIVGLYAVFPLLIRILNRVGPLRFAVLSLAITFGSVALFRLFEYSLQHQASVFLFHIAPFAMGMLLAYATCKCSFKVEQMIRWPLCLAGLGLIGVSALVVRSVSWGSAVNDVLTQSGVFLVVMYVFFGMWRFGFQWFCHGLALFGKHSYLVYLIHMPIIEYGAAPIMAGSEDRTVPSLTLLSAWSER